MNKEERKAAKTLATKELHEWMLSLWGKMLKEKKCFSCNSPIWGEFKPLYFDHLLPKEIFPQYRLNAKNIYFVCGDCHSAKSNGWPTEKHKAAMAIAMELHKKGEL